MPDYGYLVVALRLMFEFLIETSGTAPQQIIVRATETQPHWNLEINGIPEAIAEIARNLCKNCSLSSIQNERLSPENILRLFTACQIFSLQGVQWDVFAGTTGDVGLRLMVPTMRVSPEPDH